jgi:hypothetical protein
MKPSKLKKDNTPVFDIDRPSDYRVPEGYDIVLRACRADGTSRDRFVWPETGAVAAPDWSAEPVCGWGLHGWLHGEGDGDCWDWKDGDLGMVVLVESSRIVRLDRKIKFPACGVLWRGDFERAAAAVKALCPAAAVIRGTATAGYRGTATAGDRGTATAGYCGTATAGDCGVIILRYFDDCNVPRVVVGRIGEGGLEPGKAYKLSHGKFAASPSEEKSE